MTTRRRLTLLGMVACMALAFAGDSARADDVMIPASRDNTLFQIAGGTTSNGAGQHFFAGMTGVFDQTLRRGLIAFDVVAHVPPGSTINSVKLTLNMSMTNFSAGDQPINLHRVVADWGEGASDTPGSEGVGTAAEPGDATWEHTFFNTAFWATPGGDFSSTISAGLMVGGVGFYTWGPTVEMHADVQGWLDNSANNFGWLLRGNEAVLTTAKRFDSRENPEPANRPVLVVDFTPPPVPGDLDGDGDVDLDDYGIFASCMDGPEVTFPDGCDSADLDIDRDVDLADFAVLQAAFDG